LTLAGAVADLSGVRGGIALGGVGDFTQSGAAQLKAAGLWLKQHDPGPKRIMGTGTVVAYYAR